MIFQKKNFSSSPTLRITSVGGFGKVTQNLFTYEYRDPKKNEYDILIVDCGIGFPEEDEDKVEALIPNVDALKGKASRIRGMVLTHGHDDHIGALPYVLPALGSNFPIFASRLTAAMAEDRLFEKGVVARKIKTVSVDDKLRLGAFDVEFVRVTHSIPDTFIPVIRTPIGVIVHACDFKFDWTPVQGLTTEVDKLASAGGKGVLCLLSDCLRSEKEGYTGSELNIEEGLEREIRTCRGKFFVTTMSSNISRWQQAINTASKRGRKIITIGRSVEKNIEIAKKLGYLKIPRNTIIRANQAKNYPPKRLCILISGSQGQMGSAMDRISKGELKKMSVAEGDKVVFSSDYIPGNEVAVYRLIDDLSRLGADVSYSDILDDLHISGHGAINELALMIGLTKPKYIIPIGGAFRHMRHYEILANRMGYGEGRVFLPSENQAIEFTANGTAAFTPSPHLKSRTLLKERQR